MVALLPPYVETAPQLCQFEGSEIDDFWSNIDGFGVKHRKNTSTMIFLKLRPLANGTPVLKSPKISAKSLRDSPPHRIN